MTGDIKINKFWNGMNIFKNDHKKHYQPFANQKLYSGTPQNGEERVEKKEFSLIKFCR